MTIFSDDIILRPTLEVGEHQTAKDLCSFIDLVQNFYDETIFGVNVEKFEFINSDGFHNEIILNQNTNVNLLSDAEIKVFQGTQNIFSHEKEIFLEQEQGETNLYFKSLDGIDGEININSGIVNLFVENHTNEKTEYLIENNYLYVDEIKQNLMVNLTQGTDAKIKIHSLNELDIDTTNLFLNSTEQISYEAEKYSGQSAPTNIDNAQLPASKISENFDEFIFSEPDIIIEPTKIMNIQFDNSSIDELQSYFEKEENELDVFLEQVRAQASSPELENNSEALNYSETISLEDLTSISDYEDLVFQDALEIIE